MIKKDLSIKITEHFNVPVNELWNALTNKELVKQYFFGTEVNTDWMKGSPIVFKGSWEGKDYEDKGEILESEKERIVKYSYLSSFSGLPDVPENYSVVTYHLKPVDDGTELIVTQEGFKDEKSQKDSEEGWKMVLKGLRSLLNEKN